MKGLTLLVAALIGAAVGTVGADAVVGANVRGIVMRGPVTPVCREGVSCDRPAAALTLAFARGGREVARVVTARDGRFSLRLAPGLYAVRPVRKPGVGSGLSPRSIRVPRRGMLELRLHLDTGIR